MAKYAALTVRKLKSGSYEDWLAAWEGDPENWPKGVHAYILRNLNDPDEIIAFGLTDRSMDELRDRRGWPRSRRRATRRWRRTSIRSAPMASTR